MTLETVAPTWKHKYNVDDTVIFGGDLAANGSAPSSWSSGACSQQRGIALLSTDYIELDFTFDFRSTSSGIAVGLSPLDTSRDPSATASCWEWDGSFLRIKELGTVQGSAPFTALPMSCRIVYDAGVIKWYSNAGTDTLRFTSARSVASVVAEMAQGLYVDVSFWGTTYKMHATLKAGTSSTPVIAMDGSTGRLGIVPVVAEGLLAGEA